MKTGTETLQDSRPEPVRTGTEVESLKKAYLDNL